MESPLLRRTGISQAYVQANKSRTRIGLVCRQREATDQYVQLKQSFKTCKDCCQATLQKFLMPRRDSGITI